MLIIYQDDLCYFEYMNFIEQYQFKNKNYRYLYITHDKDLDDNGNVKKEHIHVVLYFDNPRTIDSISKEMNIPSNYIESYSSIKTALLYLVHYNQGEKVQYSADDTFGNLKTDLFKYILNTPSTEEERVIKLLDLIDSYYDYTTYSKFVRDVCKNGLYDILRRNNFMFIKILDKHNEKYYTNN